MKRNLIFIRHGKLDLPYASHDVMPIAVLNDLATKKLDPASDNDFFKANIAYFESLIKKFNITTVLPRAQMIFCVFPRRRAGRAWFCGA